MNNKKFLKELKNTINNINENYDVTYKYRKRLNCLLKYIKNEIINSINYKNCNSEIFSTEIKLNQEEYNYYFGSENDRENKFEYLKKICKNFNIELNNWKYTPSLFEELFTLVVSIDNPTLSEEKNILVKKK